MPTFSYEKTARKAYTRYGKAVRNKNWQGLDMPAWEKLPPKIKEAWVAAITTACEEFNHFMIEGDKDG